jgi:hypothetical protein
MGRDIKGRRKADSRLEDVQKIYDLSLAGIRGNLRPLLCSR